VHDLAFQIPVAAEMVGKYVVCGYFVDGIATRTLQRMKELAESGDG
jgi:hypothetical protein